MKRQYINAVMAVSLASAMTVIPPTFEGNAPPSLADHLHMSKSKDPVDGGWLPNLTGLPDKDAVALLTKRMKKIMMEDKDSRCTSIDPRLRMLVFQHFVIHQHVANAQQVTFSKELTYKWAHVLAMILKESSGDSTNITDMSGRSISTNKSQTSLQRWKKILDLSPKGRVKLNYQTNFGLSQTSADRLFAAFHLAQNSGHNTEFLEGKEGAATPRKIALNTAIAIRRLIWFYQDFAQGRITQSDGRIHQNDINNPAFSSRYKTGLKMALLYCGTPFMFQEARQKNGQQGPSALEKAMASIAYCKLGNAQSGYGRHEIDEKCFARWVTLCPALNLDIAILTPLQYFQTRGAKPVCEDTFNRLRKMGNTHSP